MTPKKRIVQFIDYKKITKNKFCLKNLFSNSFFSNDSSIGSDKLIIIFRNYPELNMDWVITGRGEMMYEEPYVDPLKYADAVLPPEQMEKLYQLFEEQEKRTREIVQEELKKKDKRKSDDVAAAGD